MIKKKIEVRYRRGNASKKCLFCASFVKDFQVKGCSGEPMYLSERCKIIGLKNGRGYRVAPGNVCDSFADRF